MKEYNIDELYTGCSEETIPVKDSNTVESSFVKYDGHYFAEDCNVKSFCKDKNIKMQAFLTTAFALALKSYTASEGAFFTCISNGKKVAVWLICDAKKSILSEIKHCENFFKSDEDSYENIATKFNLKGTICLDLDGNSALTSGTQLMLRVVIEDKGITWECEYDSAAFSEYTIDGLLRMFGNIIHEFMKKEHLGDVCLTTKADEEKILNIYDASSPFEDKPGYRHLQDSADKYPDRTALIAIDRTLSYRELNEEANALGHVLRDNGADIESKIAVLADRNSYGYVMREGALKSGGAFMPIDPEYPEERIMYILEDSGCRILVTTGEIMDRRKDLMSSLEAADITVIDVTEAVKEGSRDNLNIDVPGKALAYVIYTSGSTGKPKGVMIENRNLANFVDDNIHNKEARVFTKFGRVTLAIAAFTFDVSVLEEFVPLGHGQTVVLATMDQIMDAQQMKALILDNNVESMTCTPTYMLNLTEIESFAPAIKNLKSIDIGAEAFPPVLYAKMAAINPDLYIDNSYGPTECSVTCTLKELHSTDDITIGYPLSNVKLATFDRDGRLQVPGALGELVIMGNGVGRGYVGREDLNKRNFITLLGLPAYRSGDLVRIKEDGDVEFHGRIDNQVKLRGLRVELGEIESVLGNYPGVRSCIVIVAKGETDYLAAYFTADKKVDISDLKSYLSSYLTSYMVPQAFMQLDEMPMNLSGKIDKKALPQAVIEEDEIVMPENETQEKILEIVKEVIGDLPLGITSDLFSFGMSSVGCIRLCALLSEHFGRTLKVSDVLENSTVKAIDSILRNADEEKEYELREEYPLSMTQTGIYIECMRYPGSTTYNIPELHKLGDGVDTLKLARAIEKAVAAHPYLFMEPVSDKDGIVHAKRRDDYKFETPVFKTDTIPTGDELVRPFFLDTGEVLFRAEIYETKNGNYFFLDTHHIVSDGGSLDILKRDIDRAYAGEEIEKEKYTGYEFALDEAAARESDRLTKAKAWYDSYFAGCGGETLPVKDGKEENGHIGFSKLIAETDGALIRQFCLDNSCTLNAFFTTAFGLALKSYTASENAIFTTIYNGRSDGRLSDSVSMLVKTLPVYLECAPEKKISDAVKECQKYLLSAMANDIYSFAEIRNAYDIKADIMFAYQGEYEHGAMIGGELAKLEMLGLSRARASIGIDVSLDGSKVVYELEYDPTLFSEFTVKGLFRMMDVITGEFLRKEKLSDVCLTTKADEEKILNIYDASSPFEDKPGYRHLQDSAEKYPDRTALIAIDRTLSYRELNEEANALGHVLRANGADIESKIAVLADRNSYGYVMREGALKSGGAFMPIDPEYPEERIMYILEDSGCRILVTTGEIMDRRKDLMSSLEAADITVIDVTKAVKEGSRDNLNIDVPGEALAYVIYTSGSTGKPKGVMIENRNLANFVDDNIHNKEARVFTKFGRVTLAIAAFTFDVSVLEEFVPLGHGQTVVLATMDQIMDAQQMKALILDNNVESMTCTPTYMLNLTEIESFAPAIKNLKSIDIGAEAFPPVLYAKMAAINPDLYIDNSYGPTECSVTCTLKELHSTDDITIGYPLSNVKLATFDRDGRLQVPGALGELVIMGNGVGRGYVGREDLNQRNFITLLGLPAYRSGDLVRIKEDGDVEFHGRIDNQVKLRGLRVELGEIESVLGNYPGVRSCIVIVAKGETDYLAAYFTADEKVDISDLKSYLSSYLTSYMVPQAFMQLDEMPMNLSGKIDKKALPQAVMMEDEIVPPENENQEKILEIVKEVIGDVSIGINSDLFAFGMSSVGCIRLCALLSEHFGRTLKVSDVFDNSTIKAIDSILKNTDKTEEYELRKEYPLSMTQTGIYIECMRYPGSTTYNIPELYKLGDSVDCEKLARAIEKAVAAHPYLFMEPVSDKDGIVHAIRRDDYKFETPVFKKDTISTEDELVRPFSLDTGEVLFRAEIYETKNGNYFFLDTHHIVSDGESIYILKNDIDRAYSGEEIEKEKYTGYEFALDEEAARKSGRFEKAKAWYDSYFADCGGETIPVKDGKKEDGNIGEGKVIGETDGAMIRQFCLDNSCTLNAFFTTAFGLALKSYTASENAIFTTIYNGRSDGRLSDSVSMLVKTLPVYLECAPEKKISDAVKECQKYLLSAMANDIYSFAEIRNAYDIKADIMFAYQGEYEHGTMIGGELAELEMLGLSRARTGIGIDVSLDGSKVVYELEYDPALFSKFTIEGLVHMMDNITHEFMNKERLGDVCLTTKADEEKIKILHDSDFPVKERPAYRLLQDAAHKNPDRKALVAKDRTLSYKELNEEANALGFILRSKGAKAESIVAVMPDRDSYAYVMRQGVLKSGGAFLPIDSEYPEDRIRFILEDSGAKLLVTKREILEKRKEMFDVLAESGVELICVEDAVKEGEKEDLNETVPYEALAYVIYTSGSTGKPKGVMLTNKNLVNFVDDNEKNHEILGYTRRGHVSLAIAALTFDFSIMEEFVPLANGMTVVLATHEDIMNPVLLGKLMCDNHVDVMSCTPSYLMNMLDMGEFTDAFTDAVKGLKSVDMGAEAFPPALFGKLKDINPDICIMNGYGPTEATISCTMQVVEDTENITIGIPNVNVHVATIDREGRLQGLGALGEMVIIGDGVGRGYIGRDDLTQKCFIRLFDMPAYRSGDLVRIKENGDIEYHGRIDNQVKLRGLRVELGEIESVIGSYPGIRSAIVIVLKKETEYLAAYFTADNEIDIDALKAHLSSQLTAYMVPQAFVQLEEMPLTANGKIDKKALPDPGKEEEKVVLPETECQKAILEIIKKIIGEVPVGITTDLFAAGLSSLGCIRLCTMLAGEFGKNVTIAELFETKTVIDIEKLLETKEEDEEFELRKEYPLSMTQMGIFVESIHYKDSTIYNIPILYELSPEIDMNRLRLAIEKTLKAHPYLSMTLMVNEEGEVFAVRSDEIKVEISEGTVLPSDEELVRPFDLILGEPLCRIGLFASNEGKYLFIDTHHIISDGESLSIFMEDINRAYLGENVEAEQYTGYEAAVVEKERRNSDKFEKAKEWHDRIFGNCKKVTLPPTEKATATDDDGNFVLTGRISANDIRAFCEKNRLGLNAFFTMAMGLSLKVCTGSENAVFASIYNGRNDSRLNRSIGMFVKTIPVSISPSPQMDISHAVGECQKMLLNAMSCDIFSFAEVCSTYGLSSDVLFAYQGDQTDDAILIGGKEAKEKELGLGAFKAKSPFGLDINLKDDKVVYEFEYDTEMYGKTTMERFYKLMEEVIQGLLTCRTVEDVLSLSKVKEFRAEQALVEKKDIPDTVTDSQRPKEAAVAFEGSKQLEALTEQILEIFRKTLKKDDFNLDDNFFEYGGTSLLAAKVMMAIMVKDYPVVYQDIFNKPTPRQLSEHLFSKIKDQWNEETVQNQTDQTNEESVTVNEYAKALSHNIPQYLDNIKTEGLGTVLLTGATGFLGIHVLRQLIDSGTMKVYCLLRGGKIGAMRRLRESFFYYFDNLDEDYFGNRIVAIEGDITDAQSIQKLEEYDINTLINCAASVKHFADLEFLKNVNVYGVANLVDLCLKKDIRLVHISTVSVCGERNVGSNGETTLREDALDIGQQVESNGYVYSKYLAEKLILDAIEEKGLNAKIIRMGNLMSRYEDGEFQINFTTNNFMNTLKAYVVLGCFPVQDMDEEDEFSPIDEVAKATVLLAGTNREFTVFHAYNSHTIEMGDLVQALNDNGMRLDIVDEKEFNERLHKALMDERINRFVSPLVNYKTDNDENIIENDVDNKFTLKALYRLGFHWHITDNEYIENAIAMLKTLGFFDI